MKVKIFSVLIMFMLFSCSKDDGDSLNEDVNNTYWKLTIKNVYASRMEYEKESYPIHKEFEFGYRKKNDSEIHLLNIGEDEIKGLEPLTDYEIVVYDPKTNEVSDQKYTFKTLPFDVLDYTGNKTFSNEIPGPFLSTVEGNRHAIGLKNITPKAVNISGKLISSNTEEDPILLENFEIKDDSLILNIPKNLLSNNPFELKRNYNIEFTINDYTAVLGKDILGEDSKLNFVVYNDDPYIDTLSIRRGVYCSGLYGYEFILKGYFMSNELNSLGNITNDKIVAVITRVEDNSLILIPGVNGSTDACQTFIRSWSEDYFDGFLGTNYHFTRQIHFRTIESEGGMRPGDYTIRFTFDKNGEYFETNEFSFTITE